MSQEKIVWTVLPNGLSVRGATTYLKLTVAVSPRCYGPGTTLSPNYPDFVDWPSSLAKAKFKLLFQGPGGSKTVTASLDGQSPAADSTYWGYLFNGGSTVKPYVFQDYSKRFIISNPASMVHDYVKSQYQNVIAGSPNQLPSVAPVRGTKLTSLLKGVAEPAFPYGYPTLNDLAHQLKEAHASGKRFSPPPTTGPKALTRLTAFYQRNWEDLVSATAPQLDFHEQVSSLAKFGELQRLLGLAVDILVPMSASIPTGANTTVQLVTPTLLGAPNDINPQTYYNLDNSTFEAASSSGEVKKGMLDLTMSHFNLIQVDVDGAGLNMVGLIKHVLTSSKTAQRTQIRTGNLQLMGLPALHSGGLAILQAGSDQQLAALFPNATSSNSTAESGGGGNLKFHAEDLTRGFRVDVWDSESGWQSLHMRIPAWDLSKSSATKLVALPGSYEFNPGADGVFYTPTADDEGFVSLGLTQDPNGAPAGGSSPDLYLHELIWRWMGWSLSAQRPNMYLDTDNNPTSYDPQPGEGVNMVTHFGAEKLPKLRFGRGYRMRARVVDLAGNSKPASSPDSAYQLPATPEPVIYQRFEPVPPPAVILHDALQTYDNSFMKLLGSSAGESLFRMVIRSNYNRTQDQELAYLSGSGAGELGYQYLPPETTRWIVPPRMSALMAEHHGMFDQGAGFRSDALSIMTSYDSDFGVLPPPPQLLPDNTTIPEPHPGTSLDMPYLSDILSAGAAFAGLPGAPANKQFGPPGTMPSGDLMFTGNTPGGAWPVVQPFRLTLRQSSSSNQPPKWDAGSRILTVYLDRAGKATVNLSSFLTTPTLDIFGIWGWLKEAHAAGKISNAQMIAMAKEAMNGLLWALTPYQELTFVHAVQQPLIEAYLAPTFQAFRNKVGQTDALLLQLNGAGNLPVVTPVHGPSTIKVDINATWVDPIDDLAKYPCPQPNTTDPYDATVTIPGLPKQISTTQHVLELPLQPDAKEISFTAADNFVHKFGDTKHRFVYYDTVVTTRFLEYFPNDGRLPTTRIFPSVPIPSMTDATLTFNSDPSSVLSVDMAVRLSGSPTQPDATGIIEKVAKATATTWNVDFLPPAPATDYTTVSWGKKVNVLSTARPLSPNFLYSVPAFKWVTTSHPHNIVGEQVISGRQGGWLRVYLDRPFFSSGEGEMLGVVLINDKSQEDILSKSSRFQRALAAHGLAKADNAGVTTVLEKYVTQWGMDPIWDSPPILHAPTLADFPDAAASQGELYLDELGGIKGKIPVAVAGYPVNYDSDRCMYYSDIHFNWGDSYYPFVRLALASYQPNSISSPETVHLSRVVVSEFMQLAPDRIAEVVTYSVPSDPTFVKVLVTGVAPGKTTPGTRMELTLEQLDPQLTANSGDLAWVPVPNADYNFTAGKVPKSDLALWSLGFNLPHPAGSVPYRLIIREYELYRPEWGDYVYTPPPQPKVHTDSTVIDFSTRLVYAATLQI